MLRHILIAALLVPSCNKEVEFASQSLDKVDPKVVVDQEFSAGDVGQGNVAYEPLYGLVEETVTMVEKPPVTATERQVERQVKVDEFTQGSEGANAAEEFTVSSAGKLDLLVVVDNSGSMDEEQKNLANKLGALTKNLKTTDWQIGVITTDNANLRNNGKPIKVSDATADADFAAAINVGTNGSSTEKGIKQAYNALADCKRSNSWFRTDASLAVFFLSDEESAETRLEPTPGDLVTRMKGCRDAAKLKAYALTWSNPPCTRDSDESAGTKYLKVVSDIGGTSGSICDADYTTTLEKISMDVARSVQRDFMLQYAPEAGSLSLEVDGQPYTGTYTVSGRKLSLQNADGSLVKLKVNYRHDPTAKFDRVHLAQKAAPETIEVWVNGAPLSGSKMSYDATMNEIVLVDMPPDGAKVKAKYRMNGTLSTAFDFARQAPQGEVVDVKVNGQPATGWTMDDTTQVLSFDDAPADGATIAVTVRPVDAKIARYSMGATQDGAKVLDVAAKDADSGDAVPVTIEGGELVFDDAQIEDGRQIVVTYDYGDEGTVLTHELPQTPIDGTVEVHGKGTTDCVEGVTVVDREVSYSCGAKDLEQVDISYRYVKQRYTTFEVQGGFPDGAAIQVFVDGGAINDWTRDGAVITVPEQELKLESKVRIIATVYGTRQ